MVSSYPPLKPGSQVRVTDIDVVDVTVNSVGVSGGPLSFSMISNLRVSSILCIVFVYNACVGTKLIQLKIVQD